MNLLLYSKYSKQCQVLITLININNIGSMFTQFCIDDPRIRNQIIKSDLKIGQVPAIIIYENNQIQDIYEGNRAKELVNSIVYNILLEDAKNRPPTPEKVYNVSENENPIKNLENVKRGETSIDDLIMENDLENDVKKENEDDPMGMQDRIQSEYIFREKIKPRDIINKESESGGDNFQSRFQKDVKISSMVDIGLDPDSKPEEIKSVKTGPKINVQSILNQMEKERQEPEKGRQTFDENREKGENKKKSKSNIKGTFIE